jgi:uncharacterized membrane protein YwzB
MTLLEDYEVVASLSQIIILAVAWWALTEWLIKCGRMVP